MGELPLEAGAPAVATPAARSAPCTGLGALSRRERALLVAIVVAGAALRVAYHWGRSLSGDEVGTLLYMERDFGFLFTTFESWLTMNVYIAGMKALAAVAGTSTWALAAPSLAAGIALVPVVAAIGARLGGARLALAAAALTAANPFLAFYSSQVRSYMLLTLFASLALVWLLDWRRAPGWAGGSRVALAIAAAFLIHPNGVYQVAAFAALVLWWWRGELARLDGARLRALATLVAPCAVAVALSFLAYARLLGPMATFREYWSDTPPTSATWLPHMFENYFGGGYASLATCAFLAAGLWLASRDARELLDLGVLVVVPVVLTSLLGVSHYPWTYARFLLPILPVGIVWIAHACARPERPALAAALTAAAACAWLPGHAHWLELKRDYPWNAVAEHLAASLGTTDAILALDESFEHELDARHLGYESKYTTPAALAHIARPVRLVVLVEEPHLPAVAGATFGVVQAARYEGESGAAVAEALARDLARTCGERVEARLANHYRALAELLGALGKNANPVLVKFQKCQGRFYRERMRPLQMP